MSETKIKGRPRDPTVDQRILEATVELLTTAGYEATNIDAVAQQAGVSRPAIYRRFTGKGELVTHAAAYVFNELSPDVRTATDPKDEVLALLENTVELLTKTPAGALFRNLIPYFESEPAFAEHANAIGALRRKTLKRAVVVAIEAGELPAPKDIDRWLDRILGAIYFRFLITGRSLDKRYIRSLLED